ncbi:MAG: hypothetical protein JWN38_851 [Candidatus Saccharibacteria bacterium]|nr:hypothetical protein [Candidatus Saccharibacteria bacterium]
MDIETLTFEEFKDLPLVTEGESKEVRYAGDGEVIIRLKPTIYSYTHNRTGEIEGSDTLRLQAIQGLLVPLREAGVAHSYRAVNDRWISSGLILQPATVEDPSPFRPADVSPEAQAALPVAPPIEVVAKRVHSGTPKHRYYRFGSYTVRASHPEFAGQKLGVDQDYPEPIVRFDWRNPMHSAEGERLADEVLPEPMADWFIDTIKARETAHTAFDALTKFLGEKGLELWDICFFVTEDGTKLFGEVSPDCMRVRAKDGTSLDKDIWRSGGSSDLLLAKWQAFADLVVDKEPAYV